MTNRQEAIHMINSMPEDTVGILVELLKRMTVNDSYSGDRRGTWDLRNEPHKRKLGIADGIYNIPDSIDACNDEIARMFGVSE